MEQRCFNALSVTIYRLLYKKFLLIKIRKPNIQQPLPREQGINNGHKVRRQSISQERGSRLSSFVIRRKFTEGVSSLSPMTSVLRAACCSTGFWQQKLIRNRIYEEQHVAILLLNIPWQFPLICKKGSDLLSLFSSNNFAWRQWWTTDIIVKTITKITVPDPVLRVMLWSHPRGSSPDNWSAGCSAKVCKLVEEGRFLEKVSKISFCNYCTFREALSCMFCKWNLICSQL